MTAQRFEVARADLQRTRWVPDPDATRALADGEVRLEVERYALTANNITYAAFGEAMQYWRFFPSGEEGWGIVPVWGFATIVQSLHPGVAVGERLWGYWPTADFAVLQPTAMDATAFSDGAPHRAGLHAVYNRYARCAADPFHTPGSEGLQAVLRPLFTTAWLIDDFLAGNGFFGARAVLLSSASSKTAWATAFHLRQREGIAVIGLTSAANRAYCESLCVYAQVLAYEELERLPADLPCVYVDFAGNVQLRRAIHARFTDLRYSAAVGGTHVELLGGAGDLPGPRATLFFAPAQAKARSQEWGAAELGRRIVGAWHAMRTAVTEADPPWIAIREHAGMAGMQAAYAEVLGGRGSPREGHVVRPGG
jgi:hypothetical protein